MGRNDVLGVNRPEDPTSAVEIDANGPPSIWSLANWRETAGYDVGSLALPPRDGIVDGARNRLEGAGARDQDAATPGCGDGLQVHLLLVDDMPVVKCRIFRVDTVDYRLV
jgi:hypothetical protein